MMRLLLGVGLVCVLVVVALAGGQYILALGSAVGFGVGFGAWKLKVARGK